MCIFKTERKKDFPKLSRKTDTEESFYAWLSVTNKNQICKAALCALIDLLTPNSWPVLQSIPSEPQTHWDSSQS